jgi:hypothetical protein
MEHGELFKHGDTKDTKIFPLSVLSLRDKSYTERHREAQRGTEKYTVFRRVFSVCSGSVFK